jgi:hypothetical protein
MAHHDHGHHGHDHAAGHRPRSKSGLGFAAGAGQRAVVAIGCAIGAATLVAWVESGAPPRREAQSVVHAGFVPVEIAIESTAQVARWRVTLDGDALDGAFDGHRWRGPATAAAGTHHEVLADLDTADDGSPAAVRITVRGAAGTTQTVVWGQGPITGALRFTP